MVIQKWDLDGQNLGGMDDLQENHGIQGIGNQRPQIIVLQYPIAVVLRGLPRIRNTWRVR